MPDTAPPAPGSLRPGSDVPPAYPYPYPPYQPPPQEPQPNGLVPSVMRESSGLLRTLNGLSPVLLAVLALVGMCGVLMYGLIFVAPQLHQEGISQITRSNEDQRELDRAMYREERERDRKAESGRERSREVRDKAILDTLAEIKVATGEVRVAVSKWERKP